MELCVNPENDYEQTLITILVSSLSFNIPANDTATVLVDYCSQIQKSVSDRSASNVNRPSLIWRIYDSITKKVGTYLGFLHPLGEIHLRVDWINIHLIHIPTCFTTSNMIASFLEPGRHLSGTPGWVIDIQMSDNLLTSQFIF